jgi:hypothetical protein
MTKHGVIPPAEELAALLTNLSRQHYNGHYLPGRTLYDAHRPRHWRTGAALCRAYHLGATPEGWRRLCTKLGIDQPIAHRGVTWDPLIRHYRTHQHPQDRCAALDAPLPATGPPPKRHWDSMTATLRLRPVRAWCLRTKRYVTIGHQIVYELR